MYRLTRVRGPWEVKATVRNRGLRSLLIEVEPECLVLRAKGTRMRLRLPWQKLWALAALAEADARRKRRRTVKRGKIGGAA